MQSEPALAPDVRPPAATELRLAALLFTALYLVYLFSASLLYVSTDELFLYDTAESLARRGDLLLSETADITWPGESRAEPAQPVLSAPLFWVADRFDAIGNAHTVWLFNPLVTAATGVVLFLYVLALGFGRRTALLTALLFGLTTIAWPYTQNFFREPLSGLALITAAFGLVRFRQSLRAHSRRGYAWLLLALAAMAVAVFNNDNGLVAIPVLLLVLTPGGLLREMRVRQWLLVLVAVAVVAAAGVGLLHWYVNILGAGGSSWQIPVVASAAIGNLGWLQVAMPGFLISPGKSLFWYSPVLLLALAGPLIADRDKRVDLGWPLVLLLIFVVAYSVIRTYIWFGGANWGPRYMVPLTPLLMLATVPVIRAAVVDRKPWAVASVAMLAVLGFVVQLGGVAVLFTDYDSWLMNAVEGAAPWNEGTWELIYSPIIGHWRLLLDGYQPLNFAWAAALDQPDWLLAGVVGATAVVLLIVLWQTADAAANVAGAMLTGLLGVVLLGLMTGFLLVRVYPDKRYQGERESLHAMLEVLEDETISNRVIFLNNRTYFPFMLNYYKSDAPWYALELNPLEIIPDGEDRPPHRDDPQQYVNLNAYSRVDFYGRQYDTIMLVMETGPFDANILRPMEWWLNDEFHRIGEFTYAQNVRVLSFSAIEAPPRNQPPASTQVWQVGDTMRLRGYDVSPDLRVFRPGDTLNVSTVWEALDAPGADYSIGTYLITPQGELAMQQDSYPVGGFWPTSTWREGDIIRHNVAFDLPRDLPPGFYQVWTVMYSPFDLQRLQVTDESGTAIRDHVVLFTVEITR